MNKTVDPQAIATLTRALDELAKSHPNLASEARQALSELTRPEKGGRPLKDGGVWSYDPSAPVLEQVTKILRRRDSDLRAARDELVAYARRLLATRSYSYQGAHRGRLRKYRAKGPPLDITPEELKQLREKARSASPVTITALLQRWRFGISEPRRRQLEALVRKSR